MNNTFCLEIYLSSMKYICNKEGKRRTYYMRPKSRFFRGYIDYRLISSCEKYASRIRDWLLPHVGKIGSKLKLNVKEYDFDKSTYPSFLN